MINQKRTEAAREYIDTIWDIQDEFDLKIHTGDSFLDVIVNYYLFLAERENIDFTVSGKLTEKMHLEMFDITTLVGNILQNAMEAAGKAAVPKIRVELVDHEKEFFIIVCNSADGKRNAKKTSFMTSKNDKENHGFGLKNIAAVVEKYHGECYIESMAENKEEMFQISIAIPKENRK